MPKVYAPQQPSRYDTDLRLWVPSVNLRAAARFGELIILLPPATNTAYSAPLIAAVKERMVNFTEDDMLVAVGDPTLIAACAGIALRKTGGSLKLLKWDRFTKDYILTEMKI